MRVEPVADPLGFLDFGLDREIFLVVIFDLDFALGFVVFGGFVFFELFLLLALFLFGFDGSVLCGVGGFEAFYFFFGEGSAEFAEQLFAEL